MDRMKFVKEALAQYGKASIDEEFLTGSGALRISEGLGCWLKYNRKTRCFEFKP